MGEPEYIKLPALIKEIVSKSQNECIDAAGINAASRAAGINNRTGTMIAILKGAGALSPKLRSASPKARTGSPVYEVHPVLIALYCRKGVK
jgi:hypothetical protein